MNGESGKTYEIGGPTPYTIKQVAEVVASVIPAKIEILNDPTVPHTRYLPTKGVPEQVGLREAVERMANERR